MVNKLGYSKASVSIAMKKLRESGYIVMAGDGSITLTATGMEIASRIYRRHKTITKLFELMGVSPEQAILSSGASAPMWRTAPPAAVSDHSRRQAPGRAGSFRRFV